MGGGWRGAGSSCVIHSEGGRRDVVVSLVLREEAMEVLVRREGGVHLNMDAKEGVEQSLRYLMQEEICFKS